ncbi:M14 family metallopeptidase [Candidatus Solirubrobacter pratensis]|uniref:M14 family metallopeptidase n=1 Tax=Candidatus Solirubrobacter pratensis TaxID=1298857 RepID=UPI0004268E08|nr:M14 family metallopeptidase [Candidatus Solirubrobacter pratensis]
MRSLKRAAVAAALATLAIAAPAQAAPGKQDRLDMYRATVGPAKVVDLLRRGIDVSARQDLAGGQVQLDLVLTPSQRATLASEGVDATLIRLKDGKTVKQFAAAQAAAGYNVWRDYDGPDGFAAYIQRMARENPQLLKLEKLGTTYQGRDILALKLTQGARDVPDGTRPAVLYSSLQHAREWIASETNRRLLDWYVGKWRANDKEIKNLLKANELWFVLIANPDGYQYTFDTERLWRKNLRDNDNNGEITIADGVDPNRNYPEHFNYDREGSSADFSSQTYHGPYGGSEPETQAMVGLMQRVNFAFQVNYHSYGPYLLYPAGWQIGTPTADDPIYYALSGNIDHPAIPGSKAGLSSDVLYSTNGEMNDWAQTVGTLAWTPELDPGCPSCGFVFPDDEALVQQEFEDNLPFALSVARSAAKPSDPQSSVGISSKPFYLKSDDPFKDGTPGANFVFTKSYGDPQVVATVAKKSLGAVTLNWRVNGGAVRTAPTSEWKTGEVFGTEGQLYYHQVRGQVSGTSPGDSVEVWFTGGGQKSESFTYTAVSESGRKVLVIAAEDYTGASPAQPGVTAPKYADTYVAALAANGIAADVYDVDANGRRAPDALGVLSHYDAVVWETGDDTVTRNAGWAAGNVSRLAQDLAFETRAYMNEGGRVLWAGKRATYQYSATGGTGNQRYDPQGSSLPCTDPAIAYRCLLLRGSGDGVNDVLQYWYGAFLVNANAGSNPAGGIFAANGIGDPFAGLSWGFGAGATDNASFITTSGILPPSEYPQFTSTPAARYARPGGPFEPHTGSSYLYSGIADVSFKRLTKTITVPAGGHLKFWASYDTEQDWDYLTVEARHPGQDDWTTLPDLNGQTSGGTGESCASGWRELHPQLDHYQTLAGDACTPSGTTGAWNAATGNSGGWKEWDVDLSAYQGGQVELSISYISDWGTQGLGVFLDDITEPDGSTTSFEDGLGGWSITGPPPGSGPNSNNWTRTGAAGFPEGAAIRTDRSILLGFGLEQVDTDANRAAIMSRAMQDLLG